MIFGLDGHHFLSGLNGRISWLKLLLRISIWSAQPNQFVAITCGFSWLKLLLTVCICTEQPNQLAGITCGNVHPRDKSGLCQHMLFCLFMLEINLEKAFWPFFASIYFKIIAQELLAKRKLGFKTLVKHSKINTWIQNVPIKLWWKVLLWSLRLWVTSSVDIYGQMDWT